jgi:hypothetical protein
VQCPGRAGPTSTSRFVRSDLLHHVTKPEHSAEISANNFGTGAQIFPRPLKSRGEEMLHLPCD